MEINLNELVIKVNITKRDKISNLCHSRVGGNLLPFIQNQKTTLAPVEPTYLDSRLRGNDN